MHEEAMIRQDKLLDILGKIPSSNSNSSSLENNVDNERSRSCKTELSSRCKYIIVSLCIIHHYNKSIYSCFIYKCNIIYIMSFNNIKFRDRNTLSH